MTVIEFIVPIKLPSFANQRMHWAKRARLTRGIREAVAAFAASKTMPKERGVMPCEVMMTRIYRTNQRGPGKPMDSDNLARACKAARDAIADVWGVDDGDPRWTWTYNQRAGTEDAVHIQIKAVP